MRTRITDQFKSSFIRVSAIIHYLSGCHYPLSPLTDMSRDTTRGDAVTDRGDKAFGESPIFDWSLIFFGISRFFPQCWFFMGWISRFQGSEFPWFIEGGGEGRPNENLAADSIFCFVSNTALRPCWQYSWWKLLAFICYCFVVCKLWWRWWGCLWGGHGDGKFWVVGGGRGPLGAGIILQIGLPAPNHPITSLTSTTASSFYCKAHSEGTKNPCMPFKGTV